MRPAVHGELSRKGALLLLAGYLSLTSHSRTEFQKLKSTHTFKPPPRVMLVDSRRESWLDDLRSEDVALRRLSRTIPHGVRGPPLIQHCRSRLIPHYRAIWFYKCVNSNELRGLKRKAGTSSTPIYAKWLEEWTSQVLGSLSETLSATTDHLRNNSRYMYCVSRNGEFTLLTL